MNKNILIFASGLITGVIATKLYEEVQKKVNINQCLKNLHSGKNDTSTTEVAKEHSETKRVEPEEEEPFFSYDEDFPDPNELPDDLMKEFDYIYPDENGEIVINPGEEEFSSEYRETTEKINAILNEAFKDTETEGSKKWDIPPYEISQETFLSNEPKFEKMIIWYDEATGAFSKNDGTTFEDPELYLGENNLKSYIASSEPFIYIRNEPNGVDFEIFKNV